MRTLPVVTPRPLLPRQVSACSRLPGSTPSCRPATAAVTPDQAPALLDFAALDYASSPGRPRRRRRIRATPICFDTGVAPSKSSTAPLSSPTTRTSHLDAVGLGQNGSTASDRGLPYDVSVSQSPASRNCPATCRVAWADEIDPYVRPLRERLPLTHGQLPFRGGRFLPFREDTQDPPAARLYINFARPPRPDPHDVDPRPRGGAPSGARVDATAACDGAGVDLPSNTVGELRQFRPL